jgi:quercetin dioxygenase-like cupin family protein
MAKLVKEETMQKLDRRTVLVFGAVAAAPLAATSAAATERYAPDEGTELLPGVRQVDLSEREAVIPGYSRVSMRDIVIEPGAEIPVHPMENDMVCHMLEGELEVTLNGEEFTVGENGVYTCATGTEEGAVNATDRVAIMRVTDLYA